MSRMPAARTALAFVALATALPARAPAQQGTWALTNARIETVTRGVIERGTVVIRNGLIASVGANVQVPADARIVDLAGKTVSPGVIDLTSTIGLPAPPTPQGGGGPGAGFAAAQAAQAAAARGEVRMVGLEPGRVIAEELRPTAADVRAAREAGVTTVLTAPNRGAFRGLSALVPMKDEVGRRDVVRSPVALHMGFQGAQGQYPATLLGVMAYQRQAFHDARRHGMIQDRYRENPRGMERPPADDHLNALVPVVRGQTPVFYEASNENEIRRALGLGREFGLNLAIVGATEGFRAVDALTAARRPVVVSVDFPRSTAVTGWQYRGAQRRPLNDSVVTDSLTRRLVEGNAAALWQAGLRPALASGGLRAGEFLANVRRAIAAGLPRDSALAALTIRPAEIAGVAQQLGSIEEGKVANLVVTDGHLLSDSGRVRWVFVDGEGYEVVAAPAANRGGRGPGGAGRGAGSGEMAQLAGTWDITVTTPQGDQQVTMVATQAGGTFTGTMTSQMGTSSVDGGQIDGRRATWSISLSMGGQSMTVSFNGEVDGNRISGQGQAGEMGAFTFRGEKRP